MKVIFSKYAKQELDDATQYYEIGYQGLGKRFREEVRKAAKRITEDNNMPTVMEKEKAHRLIDSMPPQATWDDLMREIYVRETIERGLADSKAGRTRDVKEVRAKYKGQVIDGKKKDNRNEKTGRILRTPRQASRQQPARRADEANADR